MPKYLYEGKDIQDITAPSHRVIRLGVEKLFWSYYSKEWRDKRNRAQNHFGHVIETAWKVLGFTGDEGTWQQVAERMDVRGMFDKVN